MLDDEDDGIFLIVRVSFTAARVECAVTANDVDDDARLVSFEEDLEGQVGNQGLLCQCGGNRKWRKDVSMFPRELASDAMTFVTRSML
jgi:hypothetical protein